MANQIFLINLSRPLHIFMTTMFMTICTVTNGFAADHSPPYFTYLGGSSEDTIYDIAMDSNGDIYVTGSTFSSSFDGFSDINTPKDQDVFVAKLANYGRDPVFIKYFAGSKSDVGRSISIDENNIYVVGETSSSDFPTAGVNSSLSGSGDAFIVKMNKSGDTLLASYFGGDGLDYGHGITVDSNERVYIAGETWSANLPTSANAFLNKEDCQRNDFCAVSQNASGHSNGFVLMLDTKKNTITNSNHINDTIVYASYIGGFNDDKTHSIAVDGQGLIHVAGETNSTDFSTKSFLISNTFLNLNQNNPGKPSLYDGFVAIFDPTQDAVNAHNSLVFASYIGGSGNDAAQDIAVDAAGNSYIVGTTSSDNFPMLKDVSFDRVCGSNKRPCNGTHSSGAIFEDAFVVKIIHQPKNEIVYASLLGGTNKERGLAIAVDNDTNFYVVGDSISPDFPSTNNAKDKKCGINGRCNNFTKNDAFLVKFSNSKLGFSSVVYSSFIGGSQLDAALAVAVDANQQIFVAGITESSDFDTQPPDILDGQCGTDGNCNENDNNGISSDAFLAQFAITEDGQVEVPPDEPLPPESGKKSSSGGALSLIVALGFCSLLVQRRRKRK